MCKKFMIVIWAENQKTTFSEPLHPKIVPGDAVAEEGALGMPWD